ncbi:MAG: DNA methyltransferase [Alphaproteobacteria bacterium]
MADIPDHLKIADHIVMWPVSNLTPNPNNPRTHASAQIRQIAKSMTAVGFLGAMLIKSGGMIICGHGRWQAAKLLDMTHVPVICVDHLSEAQVRAYTIADNRIAELAGWDEKMLAIEFRYLLELDFDVEITGFKTAEIDLIIDASTTQDAADPLDTIPVPTPGPSFVQPGDVYQLGVHRVLCGDATDPAAYECLLGGSRAQMVITDPPYNVPIAGHVSGKGKVKHREFLMASGEMSEAAFTAFLTTVLEHMAAASDDGALHFIFMDWRHLYEAMTAGRTAYTSFKNLVVWNKTNGGMGSLYRSQHELILVYKNGTAAHINNVELGRHGRDRTNVWTYAGANAFGAERDAALAMHPTVKPVALVADAIKDCSRRGGLILDPFGGSGTTLFAAHRVGRKAALIEIDPPYVQLMLERYADLTDDEPVLIETGEPMQAVRARRLPADRGHADRGDDDDSEAGNV